MHAISQEPQPCIYAQLEPSCTDSNDEEGSDEEEMYPEIRLIPSDADKRELRIVCCCCLLSLCVLLLLTSTFSLQCRRFSTLYVSVLP